MIVCGANWFHASTISTVRRSSCCRSRQMSTKRARELKVAERDLNAALEQMKHDLPATVGQQLAWMRESGFAEVTCAYRNLIFAVLSGTKPVYAPEARSGSTTS